LAKNKAKVCPGEELDSFGLFAFADGIEKRTSDILLASSYVHAAMRVKGAAALSADATKRKLLMTLNRF
jgi:hypothetical protein